MKKISGKLNSQSNYISNIFNGRNLLFRSSVPLATHSSDYYVDDLRVISDKELFEQGIKSRHIAHIIIGDTKLLKKMGAFNLEKWQHLDEHSLKGEIAEEYAYKVSGLRLLALCEKHDSIREEFIASEPLMALLPTSAQEKLKNLANPILKNSGNSIYVPTWS